MTYYRFGNTDIINTDVVAHPSYEVQLNGDQVTGSIYLDKPFLDSGLESRVWKGFSAKEGGVQEKQSPFSSSIDLLSAEQDATNKQVYEAVLELYDYYSAQNSDYTASFTGSATTRFRIITIPGIYYDREVLSGSLTASDRDAAGDARTVYDNGRGGVYSGSLTGTLVGNIFYSEGLIVLKGGGFNDEGNSNEFGSASPDNFMWKADFRGVHKIPVKIFRCRAPAGQVNASTNPTFYHTATSGSQYYGEKIRILTGSVTYISTIGLYNDRYELVATANLAQPIRKNEEEDLLFRVRIDF